MSETIANNKRIAKNTFLLYTRTIFVMAITLYTSRVVLQALGIYDYGIYNVVGGFVTMFSLISGSLTSSIMRFITFELGHGDKDKLKRVFSIGINVQVGISIFIIILAETFGVWFLNGKMNIPAERMYAANWVLHSSVIAFVINLISVPYNAVIVAHEKMSAFAYISILEVSLKLLIVYLLYISSYDKLIVYSILYVVVAIIIRIVYSVYCSRHFEESHYISVHDKTLLKEMAGFAGWNFFTNAAYLLNTQGINILINFFFNVGVNAARGIATQVQNALIQFIDNFTTAINPQITKLYASGNMAEMFNLIIRGAKFSFMLSLLICLPIIMETEYLLHLWLVDVPKHAVNFVQLAIIGTIIDRLGNTGITACMATGKIKHYVICITSIGSLVFVLTWLSYFLGYPVEMTYCIFIVIYVIIDVVRLKIIKDLLGFPVWRFVREVFFRVIFVSLAAILLPTAVVLLFPPSFIRFLITIILCFISTCISIYILGLTNYERDVITSKIRAFLNLKL